MVYQFLPMGQHPWIAEVNHDQVEEKIWGLLGNQVTTHQGNNSIVWTVVSNHATLTV